MVDIDIGAIKKRAAKLQKDLPQWRYGQCIYHVCYSLWPDIVDKLPEMVDCFYNDSKIEAFLKALEETQNVK